MGLMDKVKASASQLAEKAQEAGKAGQAKLDAVQAKRHADNLLHDLGAAIYAERTGRATPATEASIDRVVGELRQHEQEHGELSLAAEADSAGTAGAPPTATDGGAAAPAGGSFIPGATPASEPAAGGSFIPGATPAAEPPAGGSFIPGATPASEPPAAGSFIPGGSSPEPAESSSGAGESTARPTSGRRSAVPHGRSARPARPAAAGELAEEGLRHVVKELRVERLRLPHGLGKRYTNDLAGL